MTDLVICQQRDAFHKEVVYSAGIELQLQNLLHLLDHILLSKLMVIVDKAYFFQCLRFPPHKQFAVLLGTIWIKEMQYLLKALNSILLDSIKQLKFYFFSNYFKALATININPIPTLSPASMIFILTSTVNRMMYCLFTQISVIIVYSSEY